LSCAILCHYQRQGKFEESMMGDQTKGGRAKPIRPWRWCIAGEQAHGSHAGWHQLQFADSRLDGGIV